MMLKLLVVLILALICTTLASHGRYGTIKFTKSTTDPQTITFTFDASFRRTYFGGPPNVGSVVTDASFAFGDGSSVVPQLRVTEINTALDLIVVQWTGTKRYNAAGDYTVGWSSCCRIGALNNNANANYIHSAFVRLTAAEIQKTIPVNNSPTTGFAPILKVDYNVVPYVYLITASDPENGPLSYTQANAAQQGSGNTQPPGMTVNAATGEVRLNQALAKNYWTTQQIITDNFGNWVSLDYLLDVQVRATFCNGLCVGSPNPACVSDADCATCNTTCIDARPRLIVNDVNSGEPNPNTNLPSPKNQQTFNRNVGQQVVVNYVADDENLKNPQVGVTISFSATPSGSVISTQVPCDAANGCVCNGCNALPQLRSLTWTPTAAQLGSNTVCVQVKSKGNDLPFPNNPWCITINVIELPITSGAMTTKDITTEYLTTESLTTQELTTQELTTQELTTQPLSTQALTTQPLTTSFATVAARCATYSFPETQGYFCAADKSGYYQCLKGPWATQANYQKCAPGTSCKCAVGVECSASGLCTFGV